MADKVVSLEFNVNTGDAVAEINKVTKATDAATKSTDNYEQQLKELKKSTENAGFRELNSALKQYRDIALQAGETTPIGRQALAEAGELKDRLGDLRTAIQTTGQDGRQLQAALQLGGGIVAGFGAVQGVMALVGSESEDLQKTLVKLQAAQAALVSIEEIRSVLEKESALRIVATTIAEKARAAATAVSTFATTASTTALKAFRIALIGTGIGAIVVALGMAAEAMGLFGSSADDTTESLERQKKKREELEAQTEKELKSAQDLRKSRAGSINDIEREVEALKAKGATDVEIYRAERKLIDERLNALAYAKGFRGKLTVEELQEETKLRQESYLLSLNFIKKTQEANAEAAKKNAEDAKKRREQELKEQGEQAQKTYENAAEAQFLLQKLRDEEKNAKIKAGQDEADALIASIELSWQKEQEDADRRKELQNAKINLALQGFQLINQLVNDFDSNSREAQERAFKLNKAFQLAQAVIEGTRGTLKAYAEAPPGLKIASAALAAAFAAAQIAKISQTKFNSAQFEKPNIQTGSSIGNGIVTTAPTTPQTQSTLLNQPQQQQVIKAVVVESDITKVQNRVQSIIETASI